MQGLNCESGGRATKKIQQKKKEKSRFRLRHLPTATAAGSKRDLIDKKDGRGESFVLLWVSATHTHLINTGSENTCKAGQTLWALFCNNYKVSVHRKLEIWCGLGSTIPLYFNFWSSQLKSIPKFNTWRKHVKKQDCMRHTMELRRFYKGGLFRFHLQGVPKDYDIFPIS